MNARIPSDRWEEVEKHHEEADQHDDEHVHGHGDDADVHDASRAELLWLPDMLVIFFRI